MANVYSEKDIIELAKEYRLQGKTIVTTNGCFDLLHVGHVRYLREAAKFGDILFVGLSSDKTVKILKGESRPYTPEAERAEIIASLEFVDAAFVFYDEVSSEFIRKVRPDIHVKGGDYSGKIIEQEAVEESGGIVKIVSKVDTLSTTERLTAMDSEE